MFNEVRYAYSGNLLKRLAFVKSLNVRAFPSGRRRGNEVAVDLNGDTNIQQSERFIIPFDPEARLNTEKNNRRQVSTNGFKQTFVKNWDTANGKLSLVLGGYSFDIDLEGDASYYNNFANKLATAMAGSAGVSVDEFLSDNSLKRLGLYANIRLEEVPLYQGLVNYTTYILRNQTVTEDKENNNNIAEPIIDLLNTAAKTETVGYKNNPENYYFFSGLSFSFFPLSEGPANATASEKIETESVTNRKQHIISLKLLERAEGSTDWRFVQEALLPNIEHGSTEDSVKMHTVYTDNLIKDGKTVPSLVLDDLGNGTFRLNFNIDTTV